MTELSVKPLTDRIRAYNPGVDNDLLSRAFSFAEKAHRGQVRASGEPYFTHPIEVAHILADMHVDPATIITALLHDVVEDTDATLTTIRDQFTEEVAHLVDGVTKLTRIEMQSDNRQAENFRKLVLAMSEDIRVLLVKLADRTHNMRTIDYISKPEKRERIAQETLMIFAPLAERIGMTHFQHELEDRAFAVLNGQMRSSILSRLDYISEQSEDLVSRICDELSETISSCNMESSVSGRKKSAYSIWRKMQRQKVEMEELSDIMAFRVIVPTEVDCYRALGILHQTYPTVMGRFKDYISTPKRNGYRSLHTGLIGPNKKKIEVQIRTPEMHEVAERGVAAHWGYKADEESSATFQQFNKLKWLNDLVQILENANTPDEFLEHTQLEMYADQVFCFTPKGALIALPKGATAVDFAYAVHSDVGNTCIGVKINGKMRQLATVLHNGDQIEILTSSTATPNPDWESFVVTGRAKSSVRRFVRMQNQKEFAQLGKGIVQKHFRQAGKKLDPAKILPVLNHFDVNTDDELFALVGRNTLSAAEVLAEFYPDLKSGKDKDVVKTPKKKDSLNIKGLTPGMAVHRGACCHALPGERIVGIVTTGKGLTVHRVDCQNLEKFSSMPELWVDIEWEREAPSAASARLEAVITNERGSLAAITTLISDHGGNITNIQLTSRTLDFFTFVTDVEVKDIRHMTEIIAAMQASPFIESVERAKS